MSDRAVFAIDCRCQIGWDNRGAQQGTGRWRRDQPVVGLVPVFIGPVVGSWSWPSRGSLLMVTRRSVPGRVPCARRDAADENVNVRKDGPGGTDLPGGVSAQQGPNLRSSCGLGVRGGRSGRLASSWSSPDRPAGSSAASAAFRGLSAIGQRGGPIGVRASRSELTGWHPGNRLAQRRGSVLTAGQELKSTPWCSARHVCGSRCPAVVGSQESPRAPPCHHFRQSTPGCRWREAALPTVAE